MYDPSSPLLRPAVTKGVAAAPDAKGRFAEDRLLDAVIWCEIAPGEIVTEADATDRFGLTRAAARAGLTRLGYDGWATPQPRTGWRVLPVTGALIGQVLDARRVAEPALEDARLDAAARAELAQISDILVPLRERRERGAIISFRHYVDRVDAILLGVLNPFTARHLRKLWHHSARITHFLEDPDRDRLFHRSDDRALITAALAGDRAGIGAARRALIDAQEAFFLRQLLHSETPLTSGSAVMGQTEQAAANRRET
ncbi:GntR family transcriptional regulator [Jannaschia marina]|uniref:GntR family transcriptional regulator n=1 Tax=Jannaschia marina TaxID=2741674 RepID=UPI0015CD3845|nr:GntR family transcriptional regulator [Jannaschia marina]